ncbi:MAG: SgcJ/EcaC family oxidoreductase [Herpetosiphonaceae bacterium]|nr:SgcJ/EcaC family oxidoreductase [Herpetosiphonaceae bacterium]
MSVLRENATAETAVQGLLQQLNDAWACGDADAYANVFTEDADYVVLDGTHLKGRRAIAESHRPLFERFLKGSRLVGEPASVRLLVDDVALIHSKGAVLRAGQKQPSRRRVSVQTMVAVKHGNDWRLAAFQNTRYRPWAESLMGKLLVMVGLAPRSN